jgi:hypothetical protein
MSFWDDRLGPAKKAQPEVTPQAAAPGGWWQTPTQQQQVQQQVHPLPQQTDGQGGMEYAPKSSGLVKNRLQSDVDDTCPRCGSYDYIKIAAEPASGSSYRLPGASMRCMDCNYPGLDTSEGVIGGASGFVPTGGSVDAHTLKVRERGGKNRNAFAGFNESSQAEGSAVVRIM